MSQWGLMEKCSVSVYLAFVAQMLIFCPQSIPYDVVKEFVLGEGKKCSLQLFSVTKIAQLVDSDFSIWVVFSFFSNGSSCRKCALIFLFNIIYQTFQY